MGLQNTTYKKETTISDDINSYQSKQISSMGKMADLKKAEYTLEAASRFITAFPSNWKEKLKDLLACGQLMEKMMELDFKTTMEELEKTKTDVKQKDPKAILIKSGILKVGNKEADDKRTAQNRLHEDDYPPAEPF